MKNVTHGREGEKARAAKVIGKQNDSNEGKSRVWHCRKKKERAAAGVNMERASGPGGCQRRLKKNITQNRSRGKDSR